MNKQSVSQSELKELLKKAENMTLEEIKDAEEKYAEVFKESEKVEKEKQDRLQKERKAKAAKAAEAKKIKYPFTMHIAGKNIETDHIFEEGKRYEEEEIRKKMLEHRYYDFSGKVSFEFLEKENVLLPIFQQHKKG